MPTNCNMQMFKILAIFLTIQVTYATIGFDSVNPVSTSTFQCLAKNGYSFFAGRISTSNGAVDNTGIQNILNALAAGWTKVDAYIFPCTTGSCATATVQIQNALDALKSVGLCETTCDATIRTLWMDIEILNWPSNKSINGQFINDMIATATTNDYNIGIISNANSWNSIFDDDINYSYWPLWWAKNNEEQDFNGFTPFGHWTTPTIHQYKQNVNGPCGVTMDQSWMP